MPRRRSNDTNGTWPLDKQDKFKTLLCCLVFGTAQKQYADQRFEDENAFTAALDAAYPGQRLKNLVRNLTSFDPGAMHYTEVPRYENLTAMLDVLEQVRPLALEEKRRFWKQAGYPESFAGLDAAALYPTASWEENKTAFATALAETITAAGFSSISAFAERLPSGNLSSNIQMLYIFSNPRQIKGRPLFYTFKTLYNTLAASDVPAVTEHLLPHLCALIGYPLHLADAPPVIDIPSPVFVERITPLVETPRERWAEPAPFSTVLHRFIEDELRYTPQQMAEHAFRAAEETNHWAMAFKGTEAWATAVTEQDIEAALSGAWDNAGKHAQQCFIEALHLRDTLHYGLLRQTGIIPLSVQESGQAR